MTYANQEKIYLLVTLGFLFTFPFGKFYTFLTFAASPLNLAFRFCGHSVTCLENISREFTSCEDLAMSAKISQPVCKVSLPKTFFSAEKGGSDFAPYSEWKTAPVKDK